MTDPDIFKFDVRVRERMLERGRLTDAELRRHLEALPDREADSVPVDLAQPALGGTGTARPTGSPLSRPAPEDEVEAS
jgi:hypothetical protein